MKHRFFWFLIVTIVLVGAFFRLYRLDETLIFQGDQGRDAIVVKRIIKDFDLTLLGPVTSVGNMYLGPFYYYFMVPFLAISYPDPSGPAYGVAFVSILTIICLYWVGKEVFNRWTGVLAAFFFAINTVAVEYGRFSWNPNIAPILSLGVYWACYRAIASKNYRYFLLAGLLFGLLTQSHYMALLMGGVVVLGIGMAWWVDKEHRRDVFINTVLTGVVYVITWLPLIVFDLKNGYLISSGFTEFASSHENSRSIISRVGRIVQEFDGRSQRILAQLNQSPNGMIDRLVAYGSVFIFGLLVYFKRISLKNNPGVVLLLGWLLTGIVGSSLYSDTVFDHYLLYVLPAVMLFFGVILERIASWQRAGLLVSLGLVSLYTIANLTQDISLISSSSPNPKHFQRLVQQMQPYLPSGEYNLALITESKDYRGMNYRYFLETSNNPPKNVEEYDNLDWLLIIDELRVEDPFSWGIYEIQRPNLRNIERVFELDDGPRVYIVKE